MEGVAAIEKLIKKKIERVLVPGFEPNAGTVATVMGGEPSRKRGEPSRRHAPRREPKRPPADPIFSKPYEAAAPAASPAAEEPKPRKRRQPQVAALLGGLKRS
jgi:hypothetical protein